MSSPSPCLLIIQTSLSALTLSKTLTPNTPEHTSWYTTLRTLLQYPGVYELHYAERRSSTLKPSDIPETSQPSTPHLDILLSFRTPADHASFRQDPTIASTLSALAPAITPTSHLYIPHTPELALRGLQGDSVEVHHFRVDPRSFPRMHDDGKDDDDAKRRLFEQRLKTYVSLMMDRRRSDAGYGTHLLGLGGKLAVLLAGGVERRSTVRAEYRLLGWTGGWIESWAETAQREDGDGRGLMAKGSGEEGFMLILGWQGAEEAKARMSFLDRLPAKGVRKRRAGVEDAKARWGAELGMVEGDWKAGAEGRTHDVFWPLCVGMAEAEEGAWEEEKKAPNGVTSEIYTDCTRVFAQTT